VNYLKPLATGKLWARSYLVRVGKTLITGRVDLKDDDGNLIAIAIASYMILP
jgi:acyl-coenzyme A thioesterase PaaI-like protein